MKYKTDRRCRYELIIIVMKRSCGISYEVKFTEALVHENKYDVGIHLKIHPDNEYQRFTSARSRQYSKVILAYV